MRIQPAEMADVDAVADLWVELAHSQRAHGSHLCAEANRDTIREAIARHVVTGGLLVARADDREQAQSADETAVGFVMFSLESGSYEQDVTRGTVQNIYVRPEQRGEGLGSDLLQAAETELADAGADVVALEAMADNEAARRFYEEHGYSVHRVELEKSTQNDNHSREDR